MALPVEAEENRQEHRPRVLKGAAILNGINNSTIQCTLRNMHKHGAELRIAVEARVPHEFLLYVPVDGIGYKSEVVWRSGDRVGVKFSGTEPKPSWFYG